MLCQTLMLIEIIYAFILLFPNIFPYKVPSNADSFRSCIYESEINKNITLLYIDEKQYRKI